MYTILAIDDDEDIRLNISEILTLAKYNVITATNGKEGIDSAQKHNPDLIICDVMMPHIDGFGVLHILRLGPATRHIPFIFLTSKNENADFRKAMILKADDYIVKPFEGSDLLRTIEEHLNRIPPDTNFSSIQKPETRSEPASSADPISQLMESCDNIEYRKNHIIYKEGGNPRFVYYLKKGKIKTYKSHEHGKDFVVGLYGTGDYLGYAPLLEGMPHIETAEVIEDCELVLIPAGKFESIVNNNPEVLKRFTSILAKSLMEKESQILGIAYNSLRKKVAEALIYLNKKYNTNKKERFSIDMGREELAFIAGTAKESLVRTLAEFKQERLIEVNNGIITIINEAGLSHLVR